VWSINPNPTIALSTKNSFNGTYQTGIFSYTISLLTPNTTYYIRSYTTNIFGTSYGNEVVLITNKIVEPTTTIIVGGTFLMGDAAAYNGTNEHNVTLSSFSMMKYEVTFEQYDIFCEITARAKPNDAGWGRNTRPVINVSWDDATAYATWLSLQTGKVYRLPTEAEWEYAAMGGNTYRYAGSDDIDQVAWYSRTSGYSAWIGNTFYLCCQRLQTHPVGLKQKNGYLLYDMTGNVSEWCNDWYDSYSLADVMNPKGPNTGNGRVIRGGDWGSDEIYSRIFDRFSDNQSDGTSKIGFRLVLEQ
jgi:formylglycine-generating enzyme required for sulfatase activity